MNIITFTITSKLFYNNQLDKGIIISFWGEEELRFFTANISIILSNIITTISSYQLTTNASA